MYRFYLDKSSKKIICPSCEKKTFVRYIDNETKQFIHTDVGRCDREINCGFHYSPKAFLKDNKWKNSSPSVPKQLKRTISRNVPEQSFQNVSCIDYKVFEESLHVGLYLVQNNFIEYLYSIFEGETVGIISERFNIGTAKYWNGATVFWQVDNHQKVRSGKIILYDKATGKRTKNITWVHSVLKLKNFNLKQCLFGLHQLNNFPNHIIGIVESEKTAIIMAGISLQKNILKNYIWMATGSLNMLKEELLTPLKSRKIVLYPDLGINKTKNGSPFEQWNEKCLFLKKKGFNIRVSSLLENIATDDEILNGFDIADYVVSN